MRVLLLSPDFPPAPGGIQLLVQRLAQGLDSSCQVEVITLGSPGGRAFDAGEPYRVRRVGRKGGRLHKLAIAGLNAAGVGAAMKLQPDAVVSSHITTAPAALALQAVLGVPAVQYLHADEVRTRPRLSSVAVRRSAAVVAVSGHSRRMALALGADPARVHLIHPGVDAPAPGERRRAERPTVVTVARLVDPYKGHDVMLEALPAVAERVPDVQWVVIGDGPLLPSLKEAAAERGLAGRVRFLGSVSDEEKEDWLSRAHLFAMPSRLPAEGIGGEGFGIVYLEAASHHLPVVAGAVAGAMDAVVDGETGLLVDPADPADVANAISDLLLDPARAAALGAAGAARAAKFTWSAHSGAVRELLQPEMGR